MSRGLHLELLLSLIYAAAGYAAAFVPLALRRVLASFLAWDPHPTLVWLLGSALLGLLTITMLCIGTRQSLITRITIIRALGRILFGVPVLPFGLLCAVMMAPHGTRILPDFWPFLCSLVVSGVVGLLVLRYSVSYGAK